MAVDSVVALVLDTKCRSELNFQLLYRFQATKPFLASVVWFEQSLDALRVAVEVLSVEDWMESQCVIPEALSYQMLKVPP